ncbi:MAG: FtsX-like permease family protein [Paraprevotella sp.]|nr:FtsX-like permease family protein [Paraprevotella sp.]
MNFPFYISRRYLFTRKSHHAINIISGISVCGVALATLALVCTLSVFNGFRDLVASFFTDFDPQLKVVPVQGRTVSADNKTLDKLTAHPAIQVCTRCLEDNALVSYNGKQQMVTIKGVEDNFSRQTKLNDLLYGDGEFLLHADVLEFGIPGIRLAASLGIGTVFEEPLQVFAPKKGERINMANPAASFTQEELYSPGVLFAVNQAKYDDNYILTSLAFARRLFSRPGEISSVELKLKPGANEQQVCKELEEWGEGQFKVMNRYEQQADVFRIMEIEKFIAYVFLSFILLVACFNIIGSLSMLIIDKKENVRTLRNLGATEQQITRIFLFEGRMIATIGAVAGIILGLLLCFLQQQFGFITLGDSAGKFVVDAYPVSVHFSDILLVFATVVAIGYGVLWYPIRYLSRHLLD